MKKIKLYSILLAFFANCSLFCQAQPELGLKYIFSTPNKFTPGHSGALSIEYDYFKYFSLSAELGVRYAGVSPLSDYAAAWPYNKALSLDISLIPKFIIPIALGETTLVPYVGVPFGFSPIHYVDKKFSLALYFGGLIGTKYFFTKNWGIHLDYGINLEQRITMPVYTMLSHRVGAGVIYSF
jgi:hypothetical protein